ncbi:hypothetical protein VQ643_16290, partial [Pseudomonas sp. F1_0610]|uniref:hypothetical protein n=1 Tax=Pseudomonas sp. F1_0610 TaxID=3114284 RepID=UPI0039C0A157
LFITDLTMSIDKDRFYEYAGDLDSDVINTYNIDEVRDRISGVVWKIFHYEKVDIAEFKRLMGIKICYIKTGSLGLALL